MKKAVALILFLSLVFSLFACSSGLQETAETAAETSGGAASSETPAGTEKFVPAIRVPDKSVRARLAALPVANENMTEDQLRQLCIDFCLLQASFQWTPSATFTYTSTHKSHEFVLNGLYGGLPYTHASSNLYSFLDYYDDETGALDVSTFKANSFGGVLGNDCADAVFWGWARVSNTISYTLTVNMVPKNGCLKLGDYTYDESIDSFKKKSTDSICADNGTDVMFAAYALMKPADGMVCNDDGSGHARMVVENHPVYKDGKIDGTQSYAIFVEQYSKIDVTWQGTKEDGANVQVVGGVNNKYTYASLFKSGYIPFRLAEFRGTDPVEKAEAHLEPAPEGAVDLAGLQKSELVSNYRISDIRFTITDKDGKKVYSGHRYGTEKLMYRAPLSEVIRKNTISGSVKAGETYTFAISVLVSTGEVLDVYSGRVRI